MGNTFKVQADSFSADDAAEGSSKVGGSYFFRFEIPKDDRGAQDWLVVVSADSPLYEGLFVAKDEKFPAADRKVWQTSKVCLCPGLACSRTFPNCHNAQGGVCPHCMTHEVTSEGAWTRIAHAKNKGGLGVSCKPPGRQALRPAAAPPGGKKKNDVTPPPGLAFPYAFSVRVAAREALPGKYFASVAAAPRQQGERGARRSNGFRVSLRRAAPPTADAAAFAKGDNPVDPAVLDARAAAEEASQSDSASHSGSGAITLGGVEQEEEQGEEAAPTGESSGEGDGSDSGSDSESGSGNDDDPAPDAKEEEEDEKAKVEEGEGGEGKGELKAQHKASEPDNGSGSSSGGSSSSSSSDSEEEKAGDDKVEDAKDPKAAQEGTPDKNASGNSSSSGNRSDESSGGSDSGSGSDTEL